MIDCEKMGLIPKLVMWCLERQGFMSDDFMVELICDTDMEERPKDEDYQAYLRGDHWRSFRSIVLREYPECQQCAGTESLVIHHMHYRTLGHEDMVDDVMVLCEECHEALHVIHNNCVASEEYLHTHGLTNKSGHFFDSSGCFKFGKHRDEHIGEIADYDVLYLLWVYRNSKSQYDRRLIGRYVDLDRYNIQ